MKLKSFIKIHFFVFLILIISIVFAKNNSSLSLANQYFSAIRYQQLYCPKSSQQATIIFIQKTFPFAKPYCTELLNDFFSVQERKSFSIAAKYYQQNAQKGDAISQYYLAVMYVYSLVSNGTIKEAKNLTLLSAKQNYSPAQILYAQLQPIQADVENPNAVKQGMKIMQEYYLKAASQKNPMAFFEIGASYLTGNFSERQPAKAIKWFRKAVMKNNPSAEVALATCYYYGVGIHQNYAKAVILYKRSLASKECPILVYRIASGALGLAYFYGNGIKQNYQKTIYWETRAALLGHPAAKFLLAKMYVEGIGVKKDKQKALYWFHYKTNPLSYAESVIPKQLLQ